MRVSIEFKYDCVLHNYSCCCWKSHADVKEVCCVLFQLDPSSSSTMSAPQPPPLQNTVPGTAVDTSPSTLHSRAPTDEDDSRLSGSVVQRAVDKIQRGTSLVKRSGHKKLLSLSKKNKPQDGKNNQSASLQWQSGGAHASSGKIMKGLHKRRRWGRPQRSNPRLCSPTTRHHPRVRLLRIAFVETARSVDNQTHYVHRVLTVYCSFESGRNHSSRRCKSWVHG